MNGTHYSVWLNTDSYPATLTNKHVYFVIPHVYEKQHAALTRQKTIATTTSSIKPTTSTVMALCITGNVITATNSVIYFNRTRFCKLEFIHNLQIINHKNLLLRRAFSLKSSLSSTCKTQQDVLSRCQTYHVTFTNIVNTIT